MTIIINIVKIYVSVQVLVSKQQKVFRIDLSIKKSYWEDIRYVMETMRRLENRGWESQEFRK